MSKHVLMVPFHFPPLQGSTGALRSLSFARWLPESDWRVTVLTARSQAYASVALENLDMVPDSAKVHRAYCLDTQRHLSWKGRYPKFLAIPDRWVTWAVGAIIRGRRICSADAPQILYSTYPIPTSHLIGFALHRLTGIPWIAEFRDPMVEDDYPKPGLERSARLWIERRVFRYASRVVVTTPSAREFYEQRSGREDGFVVDIPNGFEEYDDDSQEPGKSNSGAETNGPLTLLHSGVLYADVRSPLALLKALADLKEEFSRLDTKLHFVFRGSGHESDYSEAAERLGLGDLASFLPQISYADARREVSEADALMVLQGADCSRQIPAKFYDYVATGKPVLCLADPNGDTGRLAQELGLASGASLENEAEIGVLVDKFVHQLIKGESGRPERTVVESMTRRRRASDLADLLNEVAL